ncbi:MAG: adenylyltransferase/cytidyltransferase family protein [Candidatus Berkiellales bacterium]
MIDEKLVNYEQMLNINNDLIKQHQKRVLVHGVFDILHKGHVQLFAEAKKLGDILLVGLEPDDNVKALKGPTRPIHHQAERAYVLSYLEPIDYIFLIPSYHNQDLPDEFYRNIYRALRPDIVASCLTAGKFSPSKQKNALELNIEFININSLYEKNTTKVIELLSSQR